MDTVSKDNKTVSHTSIRLKNICFIGRQLENLLHIFCYCLYVKLKELNLIIGKVKTSKVVPEQGRRCLRTNELKMKEQFLFQIFSICRKLTDMLFIK